MFYVKFLKSLYYRVYLSVYMIYISNQSINQSITTEDRSKIENSCCIVEYHKSIYIRILYYTIYITIVYSTSLYMYPSIYSSIRQSIHPSIYVCIHLSIHLLNIIIKVISWIWYSGSQECRVTTLRGIYLNETIVIH